MKPTSEALNIINWNANGVLNKKIELGNFLRSTKTDIMVITETFLKPDNIFKINNYAIHRLDRTTGPKGGVAIVVRSDIAHSLGKNPVTKTIETIQINVNTRQGRSIRVIAAYHPGSNKNMKYFLSDLATLTSYKSSTIICGDFNARNRAWNCVSTNSAGKTLFDHIQRGIFTIHHPNTPTFYSADSSRSPSTLDIILSNNLHEISDLTTLTDLSSDHLPVLFKIKNSKPIFRPQNIIFNYAAADWNLFKDYVNNHLNISHINHTNVSSTSEIDSMITHLNEVLSMAHNIAVPTVIPGQFNLIIPDFVLNLIKLRNMYRRKWQRHRLCSNYKNIYYSLSSQIKFHLDTLRNRSWSKVLEDINRNSQDKNTLWKFVRLIKNKTNSIPTLKINNKPIIVNSEKCDALKHQFESAHKITINSSSPLERKVELTNNNFFESNNNSDVSQLKLVKPKDIKKILQKIKSRKAVGCDGISNKILKRLPNKALVLLTVVFNSSLKFGYFPDIWKKAKIIAIPKPGKDLTNPESYRPINLLSCVGKIFEKIIEERLRAHTDSKRVIPDYQFGFRPSLSTTHQLDRLTKTIKNNRRAKKSTGLVLLDGEKAFDTIWHEGLVYKLIILKFPTHLIKLIHSFLKNRENNVYIGQTKSESFVPAAGVPQGSILSPLLFSIYTSDIPVMRNCKKYLYADDFAISSSSKHPKSILRSINNGLKAYNRYCKKWKMKINGPKSEAIYFTRYTSTRRLPQNNLMIDSTPIPWKVSVKYLGLTLDKRLTFKTHIENICIKTVKTLKVLYPFVNRRSKLCTKNKLLLYCACFRPMLTYAAAIFKSCAKTHIKKLQIIQNKMLKIIMNLPMWFSTRALHSLTNIPLLVDYIHILSTKYYNNCRMSENPILQQLAQ